MWSLTLVILLVGLAIFASPVAAQQPTVEVPTVTSSPLGPMVGVHPGWEEQINVRAGPGYDYETVGVMVLGQKLPATGLTTTGEWIQVRYLGAPDNVGWVLAALVDLTDLNAALRVVDIPPTPTPRVTPTIDPTLAARYIVEVPPTRLPTFTPPDPLTVPTFEAAGSERSGGGVPMGLVIFGLGVVGLFGAMLSLLQRR